MSVLLSVEIYSSVAHIWVRNVTPLCTNWFFSSSPKNITCILKNRYLGMSKYYHSHFEHRNEKKLCYLHCPKLYVYIYVVLLTYYIHFPM